jgi:hypothetical protein
LRVIQDAKDAGKLTKHEALEQVQALAWQLRDDLRTGKIQLATSSASSRAPAIQPAHKAMSRLDDSGTE